jgi:glycosyltransferase involved in cell wall biosynthesis
MRILFITNVFPNPYEPTKGVFNREMVRALAGRHELAVVAPISWAVEWHGRRRSGDLLGRDRRTGVGQVEVYHPRFYYTPKVFRGRYGWFYWRSVAGVVRRLLRAGRFDAVVGYWAHPDGEAAVRAARIAGAPAVVMVGGSDVLLLTADRTRRRRVSDVLSQADAVVTLSRDLAEKVAELGADPGKVTVMARGVDVEKFSPGDRDEARRRLGIPLGTRALLWVGRMVPVKGLDVLLEALESLRDQGCHLYLIGDGPLRGGLEARSGSRGLSGCVSFVGPVEHDRLADWYRAADLTILPSHSEGIPNVLRESLACGTPFVASRVGGVSELADGGGGRLVEPGDARALADAIIGALEDPGHTPPIAAGLAESIGPLVGLLEDLTGTRTPGREG